MGGGLMQLVAYGAQDIYLTGNPQITFFKVVYRRHTNFAMESVQQVFNGTVGYGNSVSATISRNGDLVHRLYLEVSETGTLASTEDLCANFGSALIDYVECEIGGQKIDKHYGHWMEVWSELTEFNPTGAAGGLSSGNVSTGTLFQRMSYMGGVEGHSNDATTPVVCNKAFVPLQFWFCRNPGLALPLIALQYHEVKIKLQFQTQSLLFTSGTFVATSSLSCDLWADYIYLDTDERRRFAQVSHEYLIEQVQFSNSSDNTTHKLNFNHPVKELVWTGGVVTGTTNYDNTSGSTIIGPSTPKGFDGSTAVGQTCQLKLNGHDRFAARDARYFTRAQIWQHHTGYGSVVASDGGDTNLEDSNEALRSGDNIGVYSFALKPEEHQPSGTCNFSRIDNAQMVLTNSSALYIYAVNYNVLRIMSGMGGLAYSN